MKRIQLPSFGKRLSAFAIDLVIVIGLTCFFYFVCFKNAVSAVQHFDTQVENINKERLNSHLYYKNSNNELISIINDNSKSGDDIVQGYVEKFYTDYLNKKDSKYNKYYFCTHILYLDNKDGTEAGKATKPEGFVNVYKWSNETKGNYDYQLKDEYKSKTADVREFARVCVNNAITLLNSTDPIKSITTNMAWGRTRAILYSSLLGTVIPCLIIPLITKNGKTVGKLCLHLIVLTDEGYYYKKYKLIFRYLALYLIEILGGVVTILLTLIISSLTVLFGKKKRALHDYIAFSVVADERYTVTFIDEKEEEKYKEIEAKKKVSK